ncbi:MAG: RluA family pseudouridine synthase [Planctomycetota bacterium]|nr:RluA family pseudouridine synthase [Planctomycetota bacterium]
MPLPEHAIRARIRNEIRLEKRVLPGGERIFRFRSKRYGAGWPLAKYLSAIGPRWPEELRRHWCLEGRCTVDGQAVGPDWPVEPGHLIELRVLPLPLAGPPPPLALLWHDRRLAIANKPTGQLAHPAGRELQGTLLNQLQEWAHAQGLDPSAVRLVNRIDRETSGIVIATLDLPTHRRLCAQLQQRALGKLYKAICVGVPEPPQGEWREPLGPLGPHTIARGVVPDGQPSHTAYSVEEVAADRRHSVLRLELHTGRQHQIRVHAAHHGHPLVGDWVYGQPVAELPGQALHAWKVSFQHPHSGERLEIEAPFPPALAALWERLRAGGSVTPIALTAEQRSKLGLPPETAPGALPPSAGGQ